MHFWRVGLEAPLFKTMDLLTKEEIVAKTREIRFDKCGFYSKVEPNSFTGVVAVVFSTLDREIGHLYLSRNFGDVLEVVDAIIYLEEYRGLGKYLYYIAMDSVYPSYICPDTSGCSNKAARLYAVFDKLDYVEKKKLDIEFFNKEEGKNYIPYAYRFTRKNA